MPIFLERSLIDFRCVMQDHLYREKLVCFGSDKLLGEDRMWCWLQTV